ncbi:hypothetical protein [Nocardia vinacea]|uniref:hypothetical protein n=1 Tax=Nocardia vinacea TaxID=96468 RepID=UPI0012F6E4F6|nr:hypothetical protein [Nocardia vinacea]
MPPGADVDDGASAAPLGLGAAGFPSAAISPVAAPDPPDCPAPGDGCFGDDAAGTGRVGALAAPSFAAEPLPDGAPDPRDSLGPDEAGTGLVGAVAEPALPPEAPGPEEVAGSEGVPGREGVLAGPGRVGALDPDELGPDDEGNGRVASAAPSFAPAPAPEELPGPDRVPELVAGPGREGAPRSEGLGEVGVRSAGAAGRGSAAASAGRPGFCAGLFSSFGSDTYNPSVGRNS